MKIQSKLPRWKHVSPNNQRLKYKNSTMYMRFILWGMHLNLMEGFQKLLPFFESRVTIAILLWIKITVCRLTCYSVWTFLVAHKITLCFLFSLLFEEVYLFKKATQNMFSINFKVKTSHYILVDMCIHVLTQITFDKMWLLHSEYGILPPQFALL